MGCVEMEIVRMNAGHISAIAELEKLCFSQPWSEKSLIEELTNPNAAFFTALQEGKVAGYAGMHCACGECYLDNVAVFPSFRGRGTATALLAALEKEARRRGGEFLSLEVRPSNRQAVALYEKLGFAKAGRRKDFYSGPREDALLLTKRF